MIYFKLALVVLSTAILVYIYNFFKINREAISNLIKNSILGTNPLFLYSIFRIIVRLIRRFFIRF